MIERLCNGDEVNSGTALLDFMGAEMIRIKLYLGALLALLRRLLADLFTDPTFTPSGIVTEKKYVAYESSTLTDNRPREKGEYVRGIRI